jgi:hypothetical protein
VCVHDAMKKANFWGWHTLLIGMQRGWCDKEDVIEYAQEILGHASGAPDDDLVTIAWGREIPNDELVSTVSHFLAAHGEAMSPEREREATDKWRFAHLSCLLQKECSDEEKVNELQELYAEFGFPDDMAACSIYNPSDVPPLVAAKGVVDKLWHLYKS